MKRRIVSLVAASIMCLGGIAHADMITSEQAACTGKAVGEACVVDNGSAGVCKSEWNDWKKMNFLTCADPAKVSPSSEPSAPPPNPTTTPTATPTTTPTASSDAASNPASSAPSSGCGVGGGGTGGLVALAAASLAMTFLARRAKKPS